MRNRIFSLTLFVLLLLALAACSSADPTTQPPAATDAAAATTAPGEATAAPATTASDSAPTATPLPKPTRTPSAVQATLSAQRATQQALLTALPTQPPPPAPAEFTLENAGLASPESIMLDYFNGWLLVSNINGGPNAADDNGFISRISITGELIDLKFVDGAAGDFTLNAPKGMVLAGNALLVTDIDTVRVFNRLNGEFIQDIPIPGARFLNDIAVGPDAFYVTDSSANQIFKISGADLSVSVAFPDLNVGAPNGITYAPGAGFLWTDDSTRSVLRVDDQGALSTYCTLPASGLDGLAFTGNGSLLVSSWDANAIFRCPFAGEGTEVITDLAGPADFFYFEESNLIYIPWFTQNKVEARLVP